MESRETKTDEKTLQVDEEDARAEHRSDREPTPEEAAMADKHPLDPEAKRAYEEAIERGANVKGEGEIE